MSSVKGCQPCQEGTYSVGGREEQCKLCPIGTTVAAGVGTTNATCAIMSKMCLDLIDVVYSLKSENIL